MDDYMRPTLWCFAAWPLDDGTFTEPALVSLETAAILKEEGWRIVGPDPADEIALATWERSQPAIRRSGHA